jgi:hypothetical protein
MATGNGFNIFTGAGYAGNTNGQFFQYKTKKAITPTVTFAANQWILLNLSTGGASSQGPGIQGNNTDGYTMYCTGSVGNAVASSFYANGSTGVFFYEANP